MFKRKKKEEVIDNPAEMPEEEKDPLQDLQKKVKNEGEVESKSDKVVRQIVAELPTRTIRKEVIDGVEVNYQTVGELIEENNLLLREIIQKVLEE